MGLLDQIVGSLGGDRTDNVSPGQASGLAQAVLGMLSDSRGGGLDGLVRELQRGGLGDVVSSWVGTGQNQPVSPDALTRALGPDRASQISQQANVSTGITGALLAQLLPVLVDRLTPQGRVPEQGQVSTASADLLRNLLAGRAG
jgi:uncharacterized protein YidB (DUF937 family)